MSNYDKIKEGIDNKKPVKGKYAGDPVSPSAMRKFCPHVLGDNSSGEKVVLVYQYGGHSGQPIGSGASKKNWRCLKLDELSSVEVSNGAWKTASNYSATTQNNVVTIDAQVP